MDSRPGAAGRLRAAGSVFLPILALSAVAGWIEAFVYAPEQLGWYDTLWILALEGSLSVFFALPAAILWAACEGLLPEAALRFVGPERGRRAVAVGTFWALIPVLARHLVLPGPGEIVAVAVLAVLLRAVCRWLPPVRPVAGAAVAATGALLVYVLSATVDTDLRNPPLELPELAADGAVRDGRPCILLISADTLRDDRVGAVREGKPVTPFLDTLSAGGRRTLCVSSSNQTGPGHASMLTGTSILRHGVIGNGMAVPESIPTLAELLRERGWRTAGLVSNPILESGGGYARGFECYGDVVKAAIPQSKGYFAVRRYSSRYRMALRAPGALLKWVQAAEWMVHLTPKILMPRAQEIYERARPVLERLAADPRPFLFFAHFMDPHHPFDSPPATRGTWTRPEELRGIPLRTTESFQIFRDDVERRSQLGDEKADATGEVLERLYDEEILDMDSWIERLVADARRAAGERPLWIVFTSDHGEHFLEYGLLGHANSLYEELVRVPLIVHGAPDLDAADYPHRLEDIARFLARRALGEPAARLLADGSPPMAEGASISVWGAKASYREERWKLVLAADRFLGEYRPARLFDLSSPAGETADLLAAHPDVAARLADAFRAAQGATTAVPHKEQVGGLAERLERALRLEQLGYADEH